ncbi:hypothetical protein ACD591_20285 [Rufibacter glacialis]|uniref:Lipocalin family protein n=1 Tax=Rufibacter glacialis TaxID=1259555 RepID=A0A5M8Q6W6_9BACT|nr:hypothetical protein [Rufibacter glacialis]KAA6430674.1 hypothetical protein FOE74_19590 [Rufibacter glacialis]GGK85682.1 hypothetical protein GCM10011405_36920 [Rufibacter glacialis]
MKSYLNKVNVFISLFLLFMVGCSDSKGLHLKSNPTSPLKGEWVVVRQTISPLVIVPLCKPIQAGTTFHFSEDTLNVYLEGSRTPCDVFPYKVSDKIISIIKDDMIWLCGYELSQNTLNLVSGNFFRPIEAVKSGLESNQGPTQNQIEVILKKK